MGESRNAYALLIGIGDYRHGDAVPALRYAVRDAQVLRDLLTDPDVCAFPPDNVALLTDAGARRDRVVHHLSNWLPTRSRGAELVLIYFAGHGTVHRLGEQEQGFLLAHDAHPEDILVHGVSMAEVTQWLNMIQAAAVVVCLDCCHAGKVLDPHATMRAAPRDLELRPQVLKGMEGRGRYLIASCDAGQKSFECEDLEHGLFTYHLLRGLAGQADENGDGKVGVTELFAYVRRAVAAEALSRFQQPQTPWISSVYGDEAYIARPAASTVRPAAPFADESTARPLEGLLSGGDEELVRALRRLKQRPDGATAGTLCRCLAHPREEVRQLARQALQALGWPQATAAVEHLARGGDEHMGEILDGLAAFEAHPELVDLFDRLVGHLKGDVRNRAILLLERKRLALQMERMKRLFEEIRSPYRLRRVLGQGLITAVYQARMEGSDLDVVVRLLRPELAAQPAVRADFLDLARKSLHFVHQNLVTTREVRAFGEHGIYFAVCDYVDGVTLQQVLDAGKRFETWQVVHALRQLLGALAPLHARGVVHGGIKPSNIFLSGQERVVLGDACLPPQGIGLALQRLAYDYRYVAPEAFSRKAGPAADLYALGCVAYELLCGQPPFVGDNYVQLAARHMHDVVKRASFVNPRVHPAWDKFLARLLAPNDKNRFTDLAHAEQGLEQLQRAMRNPPPPPPDASLPARPDETMLAPAAEDPAPPRRDEAAGPADSPTIVPLLRDASVNQYRDMLSVMPFEPGAEGPAPPAPRPPQTIPGYQILRVVGQGGMGSVYQARQERLDRVVALKVLPLRFGGKEGTARFTREARAVARLQHPNIVGIYDLGEHEGQLYYSMEYCEGGTLLDLMRKQPLPPRDAAALLVELAQGVQHAHELGILHRDLKPSNILLAANGQPRIGDFGLARIQEQGYHEDAQATRAGAILGTPSYMAPEQARGDQKLIGPQTDVYGLGAILYQMLTGKPPVRGGTVMQVLAQVLHDMPPSPHELVPNIDPDLELICLRCLARAPGDRYPSARAVANDLLRWLSGLQVAGSEPPPGAAPPGSPAGPPPSPPVPDVWSRRAPAIQFPTPAPPDPELVAQPLPQPARARQRRPRSAWPWAVVLLIVLLALGLLWFLRA